MNINQIIPDELKEKLERLSEKANELSSLMLDIEDITKEDMHPFVGEKGIELYTDNYTKEDGYETKLILSWESFWSKFMSAEGAFFPLSTLSIMHKDLGEILKIADDVYDEHGDPDEEKYDNMQNLIKDKTKKWIIE